MHSILHKITIEAQPEQLYQALTSQEGLSSWWTRCDAGEKVGESNRFYFGPNGEHQVEMAINDLKPGSLVSWQCSNGPWQNTGAFDFKISSDERGAVLHFSHEGWPETDDFYQHCNAKWGYFLAVSLKSYLETGKGQPHPQDPNI